MKNHEVNEIKIRYNKILKEMEWALNDLEVIACPACNGFKTVRVSSGLPNPDQWEEQCSFCEYEGTVTPKKFMSYWQGRMNFQTDEELEKKRSEMPF